MAEKMTCTQCGMPCDAGEYHPYAAGLMFKACHNSETVRANLAQPSQAVDVGAIREVINYLQDEGNACIATGDGLDAQWGSRILSMGRKLTRAISGEKSGPVDGWKLVPIEPTSAMLAAAQGENVAKGQRQLPRYGTLRRKWAAMLAASPAPDKEGL